jgi:hypothetical protein
MGLGMRPWIRYLRRNRIAPTVRPAAERGNSQLYGPPGQAVNSFKNQELRHRIALTRPIAVRIMPTEPQTDTGTEKWA